MDLYTIIYFVSILFIVYSWFSIKNNLKNLAANYYFIFSIFLSLWFLLYFLFYLFNDTKYILLTSKFAFLFSIFWIYNFFQFINNFWLNRIKSKLTMILEIIFLSLTWYLYIITDLILKWVKLNNSDNIYYEVFWNYIIIHYILTILLSIFIILSFYFRLRKLEFINKIRLKNIFYSFLFFLFFWVLFQTILPYFWIHLFVKEIIFFIIPFIIFSWHTLNKYHFSDISLRYNEIISFSTSLFIVVIFLFYRKNILIDSFYNNSNLWWINSFFTYIDIVFSITLFFILYKTFISLLPLNSNYDKFLKLLNKLKEQIPFLIDFDWLQLHLKKYVSSNFNVNYVNINLNLDKYTQIIKYLNTKKTNDIFINDVVFLSENNYKFDLQKLKREVWDDIYLIIPMLNNSWELIWCFELWKKPFSEHYFTDEIQIIKDFVSFLSGHLKYIEIYSKINYLTINLDTEVDKKTIEYNNLINKLKEFISISSHEMKTPIMSISLQVESIIDDISDWIVDINQINWELSILKNQIYKISDLVKVLFNIERYDIWKVSLYIEKINFKTLIFSELDSIKKLNQNLNIEIDYDFNIDYIDIDKVQFSQVISNLLHNALKFSSKEKPVIRVEVRQIKNNIKIQIEDNWNWFKKREQEFIFEKYSTGYWKSIWLWLGLYLCKKIVELHSWTIKASNSKKVGGAMISITVPKYQKKEN